MSPKKNHVHKFKRYVYDSGYTIFFCTLDNCPYKVKVELTLGKLNICWRCGHEFPMNEYAIRLARPHCVDCQKDKEGKLKVPNKPKLVKGDVNVIDDLRNRMLSTIGQTGSSVNTENKDDLL